MVNYTNPDPDPKDPRGLQYRAWLWSPASRKDILRTLEAMAIAAQTNSYLPFVLRAGLEELRHRHRTPKLKKQRKERLPGGKTRGQLWSGIPRFISIGELRNQEGRGWAVICSGRLGCHPQWMTRANDEVAAWGKARAHWEAKHRRKARD